MDRTTVYVSATPRAEDILLAQRYAMVGVGQAAQASLGTSTIVDGFSLAPTDPVSMSLVLGPGQIYQQANVESNDWSILTTDSHTILKQGISLDPRTMTFVAPGTTGYAQAILIQAQYQEVDDLPIELQYYNSSNPAVPLFGPGGDGSSQPTRRAGRVLVQQKAGIAATSGSQITPSPDAGWVGLYVVTIAFGQTSLTTGNISRYANAPFVDTKLPQIPAAVQAGKWVYAADFGTTNALAIAPTPPITFYQAGQAFRINTAHAPTGATTLNVSGLGAKAIVKSNATPLSGAEWALGDIIQVVYDGASFQLLGAQNTAPPVTAPSNVITTNTTYSVPSQYPTIRAALLACSSLVIAQNVFVTIAVAADYTEYLTASTGPLTVSIPFGQRVKLVGAAVTGTFPDAASLWSASASAATVKSTFLSQWPTCISIVGATDGIQIHSGGLHSIENIFIYSDGAAAFDGIKIGDWGSTSSPDIGTGAVALVNVAVHNCGADNIRAELVSAVVFNGVISTYAAGSCYRITHSSNAANIGLFHAYKGNYGVTCAFGGVFSSDPQIAPAQQGMIYGCLTAGVFSVAAGHFANTNPFQICHNPTGIISFGAAKVFCGPSTTLNGNNTVDCSASEFSIIDIRGLLANSASTPTPNTVGNGGSWIYV